MDTSLLPSEFSDLEPFASRWCLLTEAERYAARLSSSMSEIQTFYDAAMARGEDMIAYCDRYPLKGMPEQAVKLMQLMYSLIMVSFAVECWSQPRVPDTGAAYLDLIVEPAL